MISSMIATEEKAQKVGRNNKNLHSELLIDKTMGKIRANEKTHHSKAENFIYILSMLIRLFEWNVEGIFIFFAIADGWGRV